MYKRSQLIPSEINCGYCHKRFNRDVKKTKRFFVNPLQETEVNATSIIDISKGIEEILKWKLERSVEGLVDSNLALCSSCGILVAKLYSAIQNFEQAKSEESYFNKLQELILKKESKATDTDTDEKVEAFYRQYYTLRPQDNETYIDHDSVESNAETTNSSIRGSDDNTKLSTTHSQYLNKSKIIQKEFQCAHCSSGFNKVHHLTRHLLLSHSIGDRTKDHKCNVCGKEFYFGYLLKNHQRIHGEERPYLCTFPDCTASFKTDRCIRQHLQIFHRPDKPFKCRFCQKAFKDSSYQKFHERTVHATRDGKKPFKCIKCCKRFRYMKSVDTHRCKKSENLNELENRESEDCIINIREDNDLTVANEVVLSLVE